MRPATARCLRAAFCRESMSHVRYVLYAEQADAEQFPSLARLFRALALSQLTRAAANYRAVSELLGVYPAEALAHFVLDRTMDNLARSRDAESEAADEFYGPCLAVAKSQREAGVARGLKSSAEVSRRGAAMIDRTFRETQHAAEEPYIDDLCICRACGDVVEGPPPGSCSVCKGSDFTVVV